MGGGRERETAGQWEKRRKGILIGCNLQDANPMRMRHARRACRSDEHVELRRSLFTWEGGRHVKKGSPDRTLHTLTKILLLKHGFKVYRVQYRDPRRDGCPFSGDVFNQASVPRHGAVLRGWEDQL